MARCTSSRSSNLEPAVLSHSIGRIGDPTPREGASGSDRRSGSEAGCPIAAQWLRPGADSKSAALILRALLHLAIFVVGDLFHPVDILAVECFLDRDVRHGTVWRRAMPVFLAWRRPDHVAGPDFPNRSTPALHEAAPRHDDECLPERVRVPCAPCAGIERHAAARHARGLGCTEEWPDFHPAAEVLFRTVLRRHGIDALDFHDQLL